VTDPTPYYIVGGCALWFTTTVFGIWIGQRNAKPPTDEQVAKYLNRVVNKEEVEERQRIDKFRMARNGQKTVRYDSGPNAKIMPLKLRHVSRRFR
jgi:hypothetical protein